MWQVKAAEVDPEDIEICSENEFLLNGNWEFYISYYERCPLINKCETQFSDAVLSFRYCNLTSSNYSDICVEK